MSPLQRQQALDILVKREHAKYHLLSQVESVEPNWLTDWIHEELGSILDTFIIAVERKLDPRLLISLPPRAGKTSLVGRHLPVHVLGRHPDWEFVYATFSDDRATDVGRKVRDLMADPIIQSIHPNLKVDARANSATNIGMEAGGTYYAVGRGGALTGRGFHCLPAGTLIETDRGSVPIQDLDIGSPSCKVWSYDHHTNSPVLCPVTAITGRSESRLLRITTARGRVVETTPDHRLYAGNRGYIRADELAGGDRLVCAVRGDDGSPRLLHREAPVPGPESALLLPPLLGYTDECPPHPPAEKAPTRYAETSRPAVLGVQSPLQTCELVHPPMQSRLCEFATFTGYGGEKQPWLEGRSVLGAPTEAHREIVPSRAPSNTPTGRVPVCDLRREEESRGWSKEGGVGSPSPELRLDGQQVHKPRDTMQCLPHDTAWGRAGDTEEDVVLLVEPVRRHTVVYDIQVPGSENFFAGGVLVHNCGVIDDILKDREEAESETVKGSAWDWFTSVFSTRPYPGAGMIIMSTRWAIDDMTGRVLMRAKADPGSDQYMEYSFPAIALEDEPRRKKGESYHPKRFTAEWLEKQRKNLGARDFESMYQQNPFVPEGNHFKADWFQLIKPEQYPSNLRHYVTTDFAASQGTGDYSVAWDFGISDNDDIYFSPDPFYEQCEIARHDESLWDLAEKHEVAGIFVEKGVLWKAHGGGFRQQSIGRRFYPKIIEINRTKAKLEAAGGLMTHMQRRKVFFPDTPFVRNVVIPQFLRFTGEKGGKDDLVDGCTLPFLAFKELQRPIPLEFEAPEVKTDPTTRWILDRMGNDTPKVKNPFGAGDRDGTGAESDDDDSDEPFKGWIPE